MENAATNMCIWSEDMTQASWAKDDGTLTGSAITAPDGAMTGNLWVANTNNTPHRIKRTIGTSLTAGGTYTASVFVKKHSGYNYKLMFWNAAGSANVAVNLDTGAVISTGGAEYVSSYVRDCGNGWFRVSVTLTTVSGGSYQFMNYIFNGADTFAGDGVSGIYLWGAQVETGHYATSYIPTTNAAVTRAQDVCINGSGNVVNFASWYNTTANSALAVHHTLYAAGTGLPNASVFCINDNSASNRSMLYRNFNGAATGKMVVTSGGVDVFSQNISAAAINTTYKHAVAIAANDFALYEGGVQLGVDAAGALPVSPIQMGIGHCVVAGSPIDYLNGTIGEFRAYPARISNSELARIST